MSPPFDLPARRTGGGSTGQAGAARLAFRAESRDNRIAARSLRREERRYAERARVVRAALVVPDDLTGIDDEATRATI